VFQTIANNMLFWIITFVLGLFIIHVVRLHYRVEMIFKNTDKNADEIDRNSEKIDTIRETSDEALNMLKNPATHGFSTVQTNELLKELIEINREISLESKLLNQWLRENGKGS